MSLLLKKKNIIQTVTTPEIPTGNGGLVITSDDIYTTSWLEYHYNHGISRNWKCTFYVIAAYPYQLDDLKILSDYGHEIGNHTYQHFNDPNGYMLTHTAEEYYNTYVKPLENMCINNGMPKPTAFRFPYIIINHDITNDLLTNRGYKIVHHATSMGFEVPTEDTNVFYNCDQQPIAMYISSSIGEIDKHKACLDYAKENDLIYSVLVHTYGTGYTAFVNELIDYANSIGVPMLTASEMYDISCTREVDNNPPTIGTLTLVSVTDTEVRIACTATDDIQVAGFDIYIDGVNRYVYWLSHMDNFSIPGMLNGQTYNIKCKAFDKYGNRSTSFSNELNVTVTAP